MTGPTDQSALIDVFIARQPIFNRDIQVYAYELLFRSADGKNAATIVSDESATAQVIINAFANIGLANLVGQHKAFINFSEQFLLSENDHLFLPNQVVIELLESVDPSSTVVDAVRRLKQKGYTVALDDFFYTDNNKVLVELAQIVKIDVLAIGLDDLPGHVLRLREANPKARLLAEKVESRVEFDFCKDLGMDLFQGYFFAKPQIIKAKGLAQNKMALLNLLAKVYDPNIDMRELAKLIGSDVGLSHKLMAFVSMHPENKSKPLDSIQDAVLRFGLQKLQTWVSLLLLSGNDDKPPELFRTALIRARFLQLLADQTQQANGDSYFMVGLFSCLDALMDAEMALLLVHFSIQDDAKKALIYLQGAMGEALGCVLAIESGDPDSVHFLHLNSGRISSAYLEAMCWSNSTVEQLSR